MDVYIHHKVDPHYRACWYYRNRRVGWLWILLATIIFGLYFVFGSAINQLVFNAEDARAATGIPSIINYQGKLLDSNGAAVADGT
ncbi:MAG: hypothetical protein COT81_05620 [Candidatus Buchananbacteria bacterium CG10_big_fil_rev_8_21_14_0_10_42_9]|uniref:Uncharacterized protein n=1 Tax=Candidatus Buchananbacteria bacterium CG10_big_fil_rev_8_21_14_0_10_42_9 TaxID=1974526 RepID=A0A2H0VZQ2_9BACT|nr:MAG: hypothetical protein COT81_05620 [Candidatus Buchananbacteria bacterium CG10_big_fil_rev_8_21_14_0_10_42_9]